MLSPFSKTYSLVAVALGCAALLFGEVIVFSGSASTSSQNAIVQDATPAKSISVSIPAVTNNRTTSLVVVAPLTISGRVKNVNQRGLSGITVNLSGSASLSTQTGANGSYSFTVGSGGSYTVEPDDLRVSAWTPSDDRTYNNLSQSVTDADFEARFPTFTVAGVVKNGSGTTFSGVKVRLSGTNLPTKDYTTNSSGNYTSDPLNILGDYTFTPQEFISSGTTYNSFNPTNKIFTSILTCSSAAGENCSGFDHLGVDFTAIAAAIVAPSNLVYSTNPAVYTKGVAIPPNTPSSSGGAVVSYSISPALPTGLTFNTTTGIISGTPSVVSGTTNYIVTATNSGGSTNVNLSIRVNDAPPSNLTYSTNPAVYTKGTAITPNSPSSSGGAIISYFITPLLPAGLSINSSTGVISGTPSVVSGTTIYVVTAANSGGSTDANVSIRVNDVPPSNLTYSTNPAVYTKGTAITPNTPSNAGGVVVSYSINPTLPAGLIFNTSTGVISGTPSVVSGPTNYTVTATNSGGSTNANVSIRVNDSASSLTVFTEDGTNRAIALDSVTQVRGPFRVLTNYNFSADRHTRVMLFTSNFTLNAGDLLTVNVQGNILPIENVGTLAGVNSASYIVVRLVDQLLPGDLALVVTLRGVTSNTATITISP